MCNQSKTTTYKSWDGMKQRCFNSNNIGFEYYGGKGVTICDRWLTFENFLADMGQRPKGMSIERVDVNGNYEPSNCVWATPKQQAQNRTNNVRLTIGDRQITAQEWSREPGAAIIQTILWRLKRGWEHEQAVFGPRSAHWVKLTIYGKTMSTKRWAAISGQKYETVWARLKRGWSHKESVFGRAA